ncbi:hypothetical protein [Aliiroseovarius sp. YM-037]|uniref:hypothetical protein n=1 Tax=Aliiroseovarius sp. YM-037 TaxID=3341728 RepID=UPI003A7FA0F9
MVDPVTITMVGLTAGALCAVSTTPELIVTLRRAGPVSRWIVLRNVALATGNALWVLYALAGGHMPILIFCGINALMTGALAARQMRLVVPHTPLLSNPKKEGTEI